MKPLISLIVPVYNAGKYLCRCIESLIAQDYGNLEIMLVDDGSTDGSGEICDTYAGRYENISVIHQDNSGASKARLNGIRAANGDYMVFADSDDYVSPRYVSALYDAIGETGADISLCDVRRVERCERGNFDDVCPVMPIGPKELFGRFFRYDFWGFCGACYRHSLFESLDFPEATVNEDYYVKLQILAKVKSIAYVPCALYCYEKHPGSLSNLSLSLKALGEVDNTLAAWRFCKEHLPEYSGEALSIAAESATKWLEPLTRDRSRRYDGYLSRIMGFINHNIRDILTERHLLWKTKVVLAVRYYYALWRYSDISNERGKLDNKDKAAEESI